MLVPDHLQVEDPGDQRQAEQKHDGGSEQHPPPDQAVFLAGISQGQTGRHSARKQR